MFSVASSYSLFEGYVHVGQCHARGSMLSSALSIAAFASLFTYALQSENMSTCRAFDPKFASHVRILRKGIPTCRAQSPKLHEFQVLCWRNPDIYSMYIYIHTLIRAT